MDTHNDNDNDNVEYEERTYIDLNTVTVGMKITAVTCTYSQKYMITPGYEDYNRVCSGTVICIGKTPFDIVIRMDDGTETHAFLVDPGIDGIIEAYIIQ